MGPWLASLLLTVELGAGFGAATATVLSTDDRSLLLELAVEVESSAQAVLVHILLPGEATVTLPMLQAGDGSHRITTEVRRADYRIVFEIVGDPGLLSAPVALSDLGVPVGPEVTGGTSPEAGAAPDSGWLWLGLAFGAASLSALAFWVLAGGDDSVDHDGVSAEGA